MIAGQTRETIAELGDLPSFVGIYPERLPGGTKIE
jgi:hypothetical protein